MKLHGNAALSWQGRRRMAEHVVLEGWTLKASAQAAGVSVRCCRKWVARYRLQGTAGLVDRSSAPKRVANRTPQDRIEAIVALRQLRMTAAEIAETLSMADSSKRSAMSARGRASSYTSTSSAWAGSRAGPASASAAGCASIGTHG